MSDTPEPLRFETTDDDAGERWDRWIAKAAHVSRQKAMALLDEGRVRVGRRRPKKGERVEPGLTVEVLLPEVTDAPVPQPDQPLTVLHEDPLLLALDKPAGTSMHPLQPGETGTLANAVVARFPDVTGASPEERCPGLVHRLDRETSGVVLWARRREAFDHLRAQFAAKTVEKRYHALVDGFVEGVGELVVPLAHDPKSDKRMIATPYPADAEKLKARPAITRYRALGHGGGATLLEIEIPTGVMHQIRAHFSFVGYPVLGDPLYGGRDVGTGDRHLLHASSIGFEHPDGSGRVRYAAPLPADFRAVLDRFGIQPP